MKKYLIYLLLFGLIAAFTTAPNNVHAIIPASEPEVWEWYGEGVTGEVIPMDTITTTPREWYQLKANGLKVDGATKICHEFNAGRYGWTGEIFHLVGDTWLKLPTTIGWVPNDEGHYMACAMAPAAGTYALFGYWTMPDDYVKPFPSCSSLGFDPPLMEMNTTVTPSPFKVEFHSFTGSWSAFPDTSIQFVILNSNPQLSGNLSATDLTGPAGAFDFGCFPWYYEGPVVDHISFTIRLITPVCYDDTPVYYMVESPGPE